MSDYVIEVNDLGKAFSYSKSAVSLRRLLTRDFLFQRGKQGKKEVLKNINFRVKRGECLGIIGSNGAGKSTLLKCLSRVVWPDAGSIEIMGSFSSMLEVGTGFYPDLTGRENIFMSGSLLGMSKAEIVQAFERIVDFAELRDYIDTPVRHYSSGMYVRLGFAVSSLLSSDIVAIDEVLAVGDNHFKKKCINFLSNQFYNQGKTLLVVSHDMHLIKEICSRCLVISNGIITYDGNPEGAIREYLGVEQALDEALSIKNEMLAITSFRIESQHLKTIGKIRSGQKLDIELGLTLFEKIPDLIVDLKLRHAERGPIAAFNNITEDTHLFLDKGKHKICCSIDHLPLNDGTYTFDLEIQRRNKVLLAQTNIGKLEVEGTIFYPSGRTHRVKDGLFLIRSQWQSEK